MNKHKISFRLLWTVFFWGGAAISARLLLNHTTPSFATILRFGGATFILFFCSKLPLRDIKISFNDHIKYLILGILGVTICYLFYFVGLNKSTAFNAALYETTTPLLTYLLCMFLKKERFRIHKLLSIFIAYVGVAIVTCGGDYNRLLTLDLNIGDLLLILSTVSLSLYNILFKDYHNDIPSSLETYYIFLYGTIGLIPWIIYDRIININFHFTLTTVSFISVIFLALGSSVIAYILYNQSISQIGIADTAIYINMVPVVTIILSILILNETPHWSQIIGAIIILLGMFIYQSPYFTIKIRHTKK